MKNQRIIVPVDFTEVSKQAVEVAVHIARRSRMPITLLHVDGSHEGDDPLVKMKSLAEKHEQDLPGFFESVVRHGNPLQEIIKQSSNEDYGLMVIGSHGYKGLREKIFGTDILKLLKSVTLPALTIGREFHPVQYTFNPLLFPVGTHASFLHQIRAGIAFAKIFDAEIHLYTIEKPGVEWPEELRNNIKKAESEFENAGIRYNKIRETDTSFSVGYAKQILDYATRCNAGLIALMANAAPEYAYIADTDKVNLLTNKTGIPVLSVNEKTRID